mmetsp:Transcript_30169/g.65099  ORF Transcript_30169/g.65099 Transcript_30169/m.65099 type:complete len:251 (-) Transcript_30169:1387-2139(-)
MIMVTQKFFLQLLLVATLGLTVGACQSCLMDLTMSGMFGTKKHHHTTSVGRQEIFHSSAIPLGILKSGSTLPNGLGSSSPSSLRVIDSPAWRFLALRKLISIVYDNRMYSIKTNAILINAGSVRTKKRWAGGLFADELSENDDSQERGKGDGKEMVDESAESKSGDEEEIMSTGMIMAIGFYKEWISPLLPPACRFLPTCSQYGAQAIKQFGPQKGLILTAWRLARCSPFGGRGYDPPVWPPVAYTHGSY